MSHRFWGPGYFQGQNTNFFLFLSFFPLQLNTCKKQSFTEEEGGLSARTQARGLSARTQGTHTSDTLCDV
jgi:hypothetical protein